MGVHSQSECPWGKTSMQEPCFTPRTSVTCRTVCVLHKTEFLSKINWELGSWCPESLPLQQAAERTGHLPSCGIILFGNPNKRPCWNMTSMSDEKNAPLFLRNPFQRTSCAINIAKSFIRNFCRRSFISYQKPWDRAEVLVVQIACPLCQLWTQQPPVFG